MRLEVKESSWKEGEDWFEPDLNPYPANVENVVSS